MLQLPLDTTKLVIMEDPTQSKAIQPQPNPIDMTSLVKTNLTHSTSPPSDISATSTNTAASSNSFHFKKAEEYYFALKQYLTSQPVPKAVADTLSQPRQNARVKLTRLTPPQFQELSTDVYDEMMRRSTQPQVPFLPVQPNLHPKRNQARQKLATLGQSRYTDLAYDVFYELETRFPELVHHKKPDPVQFQKIEALMQDLGCIMTNDESKNLQESSRQDSQPTEKSSLPTLSSTVSIPEDVSKYKQELESKNKEIYVLKSNMKALEDEKLIPLQQQVEQLSQLCRKQEQQLQKQQQEYQKIHQEYKSQQELIHELRLDSQHIVQQLRDLQLENEMLRREKQEIVSLTPATTTATATAAATAIATTKDTVLLKSDPSQANTCSILDSVHIESYHQAAQRLIVASSEGNTSEVLNQYRQVVLSCKYIMEQLEASESQWEHTELGETMLFLKTGFSTKVTQMMSLAKQPSLPSDAMKEAVQGLSDTIEKLVKLVGTPPHTMTSLKLFLETQTDIIVQSIQSLLAAMRSSNFNAHFLDIVQKITTTVTDLAKECQEAFDHIPGLNHFKSQGDPILLQLNQCNIKLNELGNQIVDDPDSKSNRQKLASASYEVAKFTKELVCLLDG